MSEHGTPCIHCGADLQKDPNLIPEEGERVRCDACNRRFTLLPSKDRLKARYSDSVGTYILHRKNAKNLANLSFDLERIEQLHQFLQNSSRSINTASSVDIQAFLSDCSKKYGAVRVEGIRATIAEFYQVLVHESLIDQSPLDDLNLQKPSWENINNLSDVAQHFISHKSQTQFTGGLSFDLKRIQALEQFLDSRDKGLQSVTEHDLIEFFAEVDHAFTTPEARGFRVTFSELFDVLVQDGMIVSSPMDSLEDAQWQQLQHFAGQMKDPKNQLEQTDNNPDSGISTKKIFRIVLGLGVVALVGVFVSQIMLTEPKQTPSHKPTLMGGSWEDLPDQKSEAQTDRISSGLTEEELLALSLELERQVEEELHAKLQQQDQQQLINRARDHIRLQLMEGRIIAAQTVAAQQKDIQQRAQQVQQDQQKVDRSDAALKQAVSVQPKEQDPNCIQGDCRNGTGEYLYTDGNRYAGQWKDGKRHGHGVLHYANGNRYTGTWAEDEKQGRGSMYLALTELKEKVRKQREAIAVARAKAKQEREEQRAKELKRQKVLEEKLRSGETGCVDGDCENGEGLTIYSSGDRYAGQYKDKKRHGVGTYYFSTGVRYTGGWRNGKKHGSGVVVYPNGRKEQGVWEMDQRVG
ncbi:MAG: hypothetical protein HQL54_01025 [Magnetococcales bacterium]|nr:hypothetical protein [Magnetococcales bacterium]